MNSRVVVLDNGGGSCKVGLEGEESPAGVFPNCIGRVKGERQVYVGDSLLQCRDISSVSLRRPMDRGYLVNWDVEKEIWSRTFKSLLQVNTNRSSLLLTEPFFNFESIQEQTDQTVFEEFGFQSFYSCPAPVLSMRHHAESRPEVAANKAGCGLVVDAGFSFTHTAPMFEGQVLEEGVRRINLGGKILTNYLKELVSYRSINMMEETYLVDHIKEQVCFVSQDTAADLEASKRSGLQSPHRMEYVLPDGIQNLRGYIRPRADMEAAEKARRESGRRAGPAKPDETVLQLNNERFMVPELLFFPSDLGLQQAGLAQCIVESASAVHPHLRPLLYSNILLTGGTARLPGFPQRLFRELRALVPEEYEVAIHMPEAPELAAWHGGSSLAASPEFASLARTKADYEEQGSRYTRT